MPIFHESEQLLICLQLGRILLCQWSGALGMYLELQKAVYLV